MTTKNLRVLFTGQPGIKVRESLHGFFNQSSAFARGKPRPILLSIEDAIVKIYCKEKAIKPYPEIWMREMFDLPYSQLQRLWEKAIKFILARVKNAKRDIFLDFHACFYHHATVEYLSFGRESIIKSFKPDLLITLIDDIYDIHDRLREDGQIFSPAHGGAKTPVEAIFELLRILDWRANEIIMSRHFAMELDIPHYIFAVKHSYETLYNLIFANKRTFYISHPISEVRRLQKKEQNTEAAAIMKEINAFQFKMTSEFTSFLPTTIDEMRITFKREGQNIIPYLSERWDKEKYSSPKGLLFIKPPASGRQDPLWNSSFSKELIKEIEQIEKVLSNHIKQQISTRDYKLVEQCKSLAVYRPCFNGHTSGGVLKEIKYYKKCEGQNCFIYLPIKDQNDLKVRILEDRITESIKEKELTIAPDANANVKFALSNEEKTTIINAENTIKELLPVLDRIINSHGLGVNADAPVLQGDTSTQANIIKENLLDNFIKGFQSAIQYYNKYATKVYDDNNLTPELFVDKIVTYIKKRGKRR